MKMEEKLLKYRKDRNRKVVFNRITNYFKNFGLTFKHGGNVSTANSVEDSSVNQEKKALVVEQVQHVAGLSDSAHLSDQEEIDDCESIDDADSINNNYFKQFLLFIVWIILYIFFVIIEFGAVYFVISILVFIYLNTRTGSKPANEISAYSVFNEGCRPIDGTIDAEQFDREIRGGFY
ncbi:SAYSVFN motif domain containing 1 [Rhodnius prolixus]|uniref:SAYSVFN motif domain containing 1 n=1 Tax=Rhodnius prolixus TaxID=13249 RepID=UPI003D18D661